jgi:spore coat protein CotH
MSIVRPSAPGSLGCRLGPALLSALATWACAGDSGPVSSIACPEDPASLVRPADWSVASHCPGVSPDYAAIFDADVVHAFDIVVTREDHAATLEDLDEKYSGGSPLPDLDTLAKPIWVPATVSYGGRTWTEVGMRYKGHSSLKAAWQSGVRKLAFVLNFDHYEAAHPSLRNQRFFGFEKLSFSNGFNDPSLIRDRIAGEIFRAGGVPTARGAFARVTLDWGDGPTYLGLYTVIEDPCDQMLATQIGNGLGELYKPWGDAARWLDPSTVGAEELGAYFERCDDDDTSVPVEVVAALTALHASRDAPETWRAGLEAVFDVPAFIRTLALNQVMVNWDSYGCMHHNYFVYANPTNGGRLLWFPWDLNEAMLEREQAGCLPPGSVWLDEIVTAANGIDAEWPLIRFILADSEYREAYRAELVAALEGAFAAEPLIARLRAAHDLVAPFVVGPEAVESFPYTTGSAEAFAASLTTGAGALEPHVHARHAAVAAALEE